MAEDARPMWRCDDCGRRFANRGQVHSCHRPGSLDAHLGPVDDEVRAIFDRFVAEVEAIGPVEIVPQRTRIAFHLRMTFAVLMPRRRWMNGHLVLAEPADHPRFTRVTGYSRRNHVHEFRLHHPDQIDDGFRRHIAAAFEVGLQHHRGR